MPLYGNREFASGNQKPNYANTSNTYGVSTTEKSNTAAGGGYGPKLTHSGWVSFSLGRGPVAAIAINNAGRGYNTTPGFVEFTGGNGSGANATYTTNTSNSNSILTITLNSGGTGYNSAPTARINTGNTIIATFDLIMGGRVGRIDHEVLVAGGSIAGDSEATENGFFPGA